MPLAGVRVSVGGPPRAKSKNARTRVLMRSAWSTIWRVQVSARSSEATRAWSCSARQDDAERRRHFVRDAGRESAHHGDSGGAREALVSFVAHLGDRQVALEIELLPLSPQREPAEDENQPGAHGYAEDEAPPSALLAIPMPARRRDGGDSPATEGSAIDLREPGKRGPLREAERRSLGTQEPRPSLPCLER